MCTGGVEVKQNENKFLVRTIVWVWNDQKLELTYLIPSTGRRESNPRHETNAHSYDGSSISLGYRSAIEVDKYFDSGRVV